MHRHDSVAQQIRAEGTTHTVEAKLTLGTAFTIEPTLTIEDTLTLCAKLITEAEPTYDTSFTIKVIPKIETTHTHGATLAIVTLSYMTTGRKKGPEVQTPKWSSVNE